MVCQKIFNWPFQDLAYILTKLCKCFFLSKIIHIMLKISKQLSLIVTKDMAFSILEYHFALVNKHFCFDHFLFLLILHLSQTWKLLKIIDYSWPS